MIVLRAEIVIIFEPKMVTISARNIQTYTKFPNFTRLYFQSYYLFLSSFMPKMVGSSIVTCALCLSQINQ